MKFRKREKEGSRFGRRTKVKRGGGSDKETYFWGVYRRNGQVDGIGKEGWK